MRVVLVTGDHSDVIYIAIASLLVGGIGATRGWWEPRILGRGSRGRDAASRILDWVRREHQTIAAVEILTTAVPTADLVAKWHADVTPLLKDASDELRRRAVVFGELLEQAETLGLRKDSRWITIATFALGDLERASQRAALARRIGPASFPAREDTLDALQRGQALKSGLRPLEELVWRTARRADSKDRQRDALILAISSAVFAASVTYLLVNALG
jgi:hypothetical protein